MHLTRYLGPLYFLAAFPATLAHALRAPAARAAQLFGRPSRLRLWPQRRGHSYVMGAVTFDNVRWYNGLVIGLAPLVLLPAALALLVWRVRTAGFGVHEAAWIYAIACLAYSSLPSIQDLRIALTSSWLVLLAAFVAAAFAGGPMADGVRRLAGCDIGLGLTGIAGPGGGSEAKAVGTVAVAVCGPGSRRSVRTWRFPGGRNAPGEAVCVSTAALDALRRAMLGGG